MSNRSCATCTKHTSEDECAVLTETIGCDGDCWAWSDDELWQQRATSETRAYVQSMLRKGGMASAVDVAMAMIQHMEHGGYVAGRWL